MYKAKYFEKVNKWVIVNDDDIVYLDADCDPVAHENKQVTLHMIDHLNLKEEVEKLKNLILENNEKIAGLTSRLELPPRKASEIFDDLWRISDEF